jgi:hypothetical protein
LLPERKNHKRQIHTVDDTNDGQIGDRRFVVGSQHFTGNRPSDHRCQQKRDADNDEQKNDDQRQA